MRSGERLYHTSDKSRVVRESDPDATFLAYAVGDEVPDDVLSKLAPNLSTEDAAESEIALAAWEDNGGPAKPKRRVTRQGRPRGTR